MNDLYRKTFDEIHASEALRQEVLNMTKQEKAAAKRQVPRMLLIAAIIVLALAGTAVAASLTGMQSWFSQQWSKETGKAIEKDQMGIITGLTDEVGVSAEADGITVTVDSVTRGEDVIWLLLEVSGDLPAREEVEADLEAAGAFPEDTSSADARMGCLFKEMELTFDPAVLGPKSGYSFSMEQANIRADGSITLLVQYRPFDRKISLLEALEVTLELADMEVGITSCFGSVAVKGGPWKLAFSLPAIEPPEPRTTGSGQAAGVVPLNVSYAESITMDPPARENMAFSDICVTPIGFTIFWEDPEQTSRLFPPPGFWFVIMADGTEFQAEPQGAVYEDLPGGQKCSRRYWPVPVDLAQVKSLELRYNEEVQTFILQ